ncbi:MAG: DUF4296 domain-containing protein [Dysgonamonadaceae bacterium]|jgi:hypothetical protein|nr:DUF4296 domain-containing protein [Dysgonamonadaceae bacterium]
MKHRPVPYLPIIIILGIVISACQRPKNVLDKKKMESLMYDVYIAEALMDNDYRNFDSPQKKEAFFNSIFEKHHTTQEQWDTSLVYYSDKIDIYLRMNDSVKARIQRLQKTLANEQNKILQQEKDVYRRTKTTTYIPSTYSFAEADICQGFRFRLDSATTATQIGQDQFDFGFDVLGIPSTTQSVLKSVLMLEYKDTTIYRTTDISQNQSYNTSASRFIANDTLKTISGFVHLNSQRERFRGIHLYNIRLASRTHAGQNTADENVQDSIKKPLMRLEKVAKMDTLERISLQ